MRFLLFFLILATSANAAIYNERPFVDSSSNSAGTVNSGITGQAAYYSAATGISSFNGLLTSGTDVTALRLSGTSIASDTQQLYQRCDPTCHTDGAMGSRYFYTNNDSQVDRLLISATTAYITPTAQLEVYTSGSTIGISTTTMNATTLATTNVSASGTISASIFLAGAGTLAAPSNAFSANPTDGQYRGGNHQFNWVNNGVIYDRIAQSTRGLFVSGTTPSATVQVGGNCPATPCPGTFMTFGQASFNTGTTGASVTVPLGGLYVSGTAYIAGGISATSSIFFTNMGTGTAISNICVTATGQIVSTTTLSGCLGVSDPALKKDIRTLPYGLAEVMAIDPVMYRDIRTDKGAYAGEQIGLLAYSVDRDGQRYRGVEAVMPELVDQQGSTYNGKHYKGLIYERLAPVLINAIHEQQQEIDTLKAEMDELRDAIGFHPQPWWKVW